MSGTNDYKLFCTATPHSGGNSLTPAEYAALSTLRAGGFASGTANSAQMNTVWRQATMGTAALATLISNSGLDALDNENVATFAANLLTALAALLPQPHSVGDLKMVGGTGVPANWHRCDGTSLQRTQYPDLFTAISTLYGAVDSDHFNLPDMRGMFPRGVDNGRGVDPARSLGSTQADQFPSHSHSIDTVGATGRAQPGDSGDLLVNVPGAGTATLASGVGTETRPKNVALNFLIYIGVAAF